MDYFSGRADLNVSFTILVGLGENCIRKPKNVPKQEAATQIARERPVRDSAVQNDEASAGALDFAIQHRPDFGLKNDQDGGLKTSQHAPDGESIIDGRVEDRVYQRGELFLGDFAPGHGGHRDIERRSGHSRAQFPDQPSRRNHFADRNGVQPNGAGRRRWNQRGKAAQAFPEAAQVSGVTDRAVNEIEYKQRGCCDAADQVKEPDENTFDLLDRVHGSGREPGG